MRSAWASVVGSGLRRRDGAAQDAVLVVVLGQRIERDLAVAAARGDHRQLAAEVGRRLDDGGRARRWPAKAPSASRGSSHPGLALAVVAAAAGLQQQRLAQPLAAPRRCPPGSSTSAKATVGAPASFRKVFSASRSWATARACAPGATAAPAASRIAIACGRHVLELEGDHVGDRGQLQQLDRVVVGAGRSVGGDALGRRVGLGVQHRDVEAEPGRRHRQHAAQAGRRPGCRSRRPARAGIAPSLNPRPSRGTAVGLAPRRTRPAARRAPASDSARIRAAIRPALRAPASPTASVPTGTPAGICAIDSRESRPSSVLLRTGTPSTGRSVSDGGHARQVRRAAGAGDDHLDAGRLRALGEGVEPLRRAVGGNDASAPGDAQLGQGFAGRLHRRPVGAAAHDQRHRRVCYPCPPCSERRGV